MTTKQRVLARVNELGATIEYGTAAGHFEITIDAPARQHWAADDTHQLVHSSWDHEAASNLWADALDRLSYGLDPCDPSNPDCADQETEGTKGTDDKGTVSFGSGRSHLIGDDDAILEEERRNRHA